MVILYLENVELDLGTSGRMFPDICISLHKFDVILVGKTNIKDSLVVSKKITKRVNL